MDSKLSYFAIKDILLEQWNEGDLSPSEAISLYESMIKRPLDIKSREAFINMLSDWNDLGIQEYVKVEKSLLEKTGSKDMTSEQFIEMFISKHLQL